MGDVPKGITRTLPVALHNEGTSPVFLIQLDSHLRVAVTDRASRDYLWRVDPGQSFYVAATLGATAATDTGYTHFGASVLYEADGIRDSIRIDISAQVTDSLTAPYATGDYLGTIGMCMRSHTLNRTFGFPIVIANPTPQSITVDSVLWHADTTSLFSVGAMYTKGPRGNDMTVRPPFTILPHNIATALISPAAADTVTDANGSLSVYFTDSALRSLTTGCSFGYSVAWQQPSVHLQSCLFPDEYVVDTSITVGTCDSSVRICLTSCSVDTTWITNVIVVGPDSESLYLDLDGSSHLPTHFEAGSAQGRLRFCPTREGSARDTLILFYTTTGSLSESAYLPVVTSATKSSDVPSVPEGSKEQHISTFPNPVSISATISITNREQHRAEIYIVDVLGRVVSVLRNNTGSDHCEYTWDAQDMPSGLYHVVTDSYKENGQYPIYVVH